MNEETNAIIRQSSEEIARLLENARGALKGMNDFTVEDVWALLAPTGRMAEIAGRSKELRRSSAETNELLNGYKELLEALQLTLRQIRVMLIGRLQRAQTRQIHMRAVSQWTSAYQQTR